MAPPFRIPFTLPSNAGPVRVIAIAADALGNEGQAAELLLNVVPNRAPVVKLVRELPAEGPVGSGQPYSFTVSATDELQISRMSVRVTFEGQELMATNYPSGAPRTLTLVAPSDLTASGQIRIQAQAVDELGLDSAESVLDLPVEPRFRPRIDVPTGIEVVTGRFTNVLFHLASSNGGVAELTVSNLVRLAAVTLPGLTNRLTFVPPVEETNVVLTLRAELVPGTGSFSLRAVGANGLETVVTIPVLVLADLDGDGIADRDDPDIDGDGLDNVRELALGTDPRIDGIGRWFYERAAGSYNTMLAREGSTPAKLRSLKEAIPPARKFAAPSTGRQSW